MKKFILVSVLCILGGFSFAQTPTGKTPTTPKVQTTTVTDKKIPPSEVEKNIDRRFAYFNRYKQTGDIENIIKLISQTDMGFYTDFLKYIKFSHVFTLKRDTEEKISQSAGDTYVVPTIMTLSGKERKASVTFREEKRENGSTLLIAGSTLHTLSPENNLGSNVLDAKTETKKPTPPKTTQTNVESKAITTPPEKKKPESAPQTTPPAASSGINITIILIISIGLVVLIGSIGGFMYYRVLKKRKAQKILTNTVAAAAATFVAAETLPQSPPLIETPPVPAASNVTVSTVEEIHITEPENTVIEDQTSLSGENTPPPATPENETPTSISPEVPEEPEKMISPPAALIEPAKENPAIPLNETTPTVQETEVLPIENPAIPLNESTPKNQEKEAFPPRVLAENPPSETPVTEEPIADIFLTPPTPPEIPKAHALFEGILSPAEPQKHSLFEGVLDTTDTGTLISEK